MPADAFAHAERGQSQARQDSPMLGLRDWSEFDGQVDASVVAYIIITWDLEDNLLARDDRVVLGRQNCRIFSIERVSDADECIAEKIQSGTYGGKRGIV